MRVNKNTNTLIKKILNYSIFFILIIGIFGAGGLVFEEFKTGEGCPKIIGVPMCLVILICFIIPLVVHIFKKWNWLYFLFTGIAGSIALFASILQFMEKAECPKTASGTPMCYYSLILFSSLVLFKILQITYNKKYQN